MQMGISSSYASKLQEGRSYDESHLRRLEQENRNDTVRSVAFAASTAIPPTVLWPIFQSTIRQDELEVDAHAQTLTDPIALINFLYPELLLLLQCHIWLFGFLRLSQHVLSPPAVCGLLVCFQRITLFSLLVATQDAQ